MFSHFKPTLQTLAVAFAWPLAFGLPGTSTAQTTQAPSAPLSSSVLITGNPLGRERLAAPTSVLSGDELVLRRGSTLGDTLDGLPGVSSSYFGPNANRPVIRGLDGDRVRVLSNEGASLDASSLSFDHAVPIDPLIVQRIEVLRGPAALLYGGSAIGGVVQALDNRIPRAPLKGLTGSAELRLGGAARERGGALVLDAGNAAAAVHVDVFSRETADLRVPRFVPQAEGEALPVASTVANSASRTRGGALGASLFFDRGFVGLSLDTYDSDYGVVVEPDITIKMKRTRLGLAGEVKSLEGPLRSLRLNANLTDYEHREVAGDGTVGTVFASRGHEWRLQAEHRPLGPWRGVVGWQQERFDFSALGDEAFVPSTTTHKAALFALEELRWQLGVLTAGLRVEHVRVGSSGDAEPLAARFGAATQRRFSMRSASVSQQVPLGANWSLAATVSGSERAPTYFELYANGVHAATAAYERGDPGLAKERGTNVDVALHWQSATSQLRVGAFSTRFARFISLDATGVSVDEAGAPVGLGVEGVPLYQFNAVRARMHGLEVDARTRLMQGPWAWFGTAKLDLTRGTNMSTNQALPRLAPWRLRLGLDARRGDFSARAEVEHAARQGRVPDTDLATPAHTIVNLSMAQRFVWGATDALVFAKLDNLSNKLGYSASSVQSIRSLSPLPGRALKVGLRLDF